MRNYLHPVEVTRRDNVPEKEKYNLLYENLYSKRVRIIFYVYP